MKISKEAIHKLVMMIEGPIVNPNVINDYNFFEETVGKLKKNNDKDKE